MNSSPVLEQTRHSQATAIITAEAALQATACAVEHARKLGATVNISVVDASGLPAAFARMPGAPLHSIELAVNKAYTAASFGLPTSQWTEALKAHSPAVRDGLVRHPKFVAFGGGLPILEKGVRIGGIGVSGVSEQEDEQIARAGLRAIGLEFCT